MAESLLKINLLPEGARKTTLSSVEQFHRTPLMWITFVLLLLLPLLLLAPIYLRRQQLAQLTAKVQALEPRKAKLDQVQRFLQTLHAQQAAFQGMGKGQSMWSKRLNTLSDVTPDGVWFTELALDQMKGLVIQGSAIGQEAGPEMVNVTRFVQELKEKPEFSSACKDIQIESIKRVPEGEIDIVQFTLTCSLLESPSS